MSSKENRKNGKMDKIKEENEAQKKEKILSTNNWIVVFINMTFIVP